MINKNKVEKDLTKWNEVLIALSKEIIKLQGSLATIYEGIKELNNDIIEVHKQSF